MATENVPIRLMEGDKTQVSEVMLYGTQLWKTNTRRITLLQDPVLSITAIFCMLSVKNHNSLEWTLPPPFSLFHFFPQTFLEVALWSQERKDNVWPGLTCGGCMVCVLLEKEYWRWNGRSMDRWPVPLN